MMQAMMPIPPIHATAMSSAVLFWGMIGLLVALFLLATILWIVGSRRIAQKQSQVKEAVRQYEASPQAQGGEQPQVHAPEKEKILLWR
jgi:hypothetical protein